MIGVGIGITSIRRRSGSFNPASVGTLAYWGDGADASLITITGAGVSQWSDKSGAGNHLTQSNDGERPTYDSGQGVQFANGKSLVMPAALRTILSGVDFTLFHAFDLDDETPTMGVGSGFNNATGINGPLYFASVLFWNYYNGTALTSFNAGAASPGKKLLTTHASGTKYIGRSNGVELLNVNTLGAITIDSARMGSYGDGSNSLRGKMREALLYSPALSEAVIPTVESYLSNKWSI